MIEFHSKEMQEAFENLKSKKILKIDKMSTFNLKEFIYYLIQKKVRSYIIDDFIRPIYDKSSLLEAIYFQIGLFDLKAMNWDALQESLEYYVSDNNCGIILIFRNGIELQKNISVEFDILEKLIMKIFEEKELNHGIILL